MFAGVVSLFSTAAHADEREDAIAAAKAVVTALAEKKFALIWDTLTSDQYKKDVGLTRELFIVALTNPRREIGRLTSSKLVHVRYNAPQPDAGYGYKGKSYSVIFENVYTTGTRLEGALIIEENGQFKMNGLST
jgi:hypothetical protein